MAINNFPLSWPEGWPRKTKRVRARFAKGAGNVFSPSRQLSVADGVQRCLTVLQRMDVPDWNVIVSTNVPVRNDGLPRSGVAEPKDPGAAVYFRKHNSAENDRKVMAIDQYDRVADNLAAIAATLDAMRSIERYGGAQILERGFHRVYRAAGTRRPEGLARRARIPTRYKADSDGNPQPVPAAAIAASRR